MKSIANWFRHAWLVLAVAALVILLDQWTKTLVRANLPKFEEIPVLGKYLMWQHVDNYGAAFGLFQGGSMIFAIVATIVAVAILWYVRNIPQEKVFIRVLLGMQLGGALGNLVDRYTQGFVTDFVKMGIPGVYYWPNWNVADGSIVTGVILLAIYIIWDDMATARQARLAHKTGTSAKTTAKIDGR